MSKEKHPIIAYGELYAEPISKKLYSGPKQYPHEYSEAKINIIKQLDMISELFRTNAQTNANEIFTHDKIICFRMEPKFEAKSYVPSSIISAVKDMSLIGGRKYVVDSTVSDKKETAKLYFARTTSEGIAELRTLLDSGQRDNIKTWREQICSLKTLDLLTPSEKIMGFNDSWSEGSVEIVLHPTGDNVDSTIKTFSNYCGIPEEDMMIRPYTDGLTFISAKCDLNTVNKISKLNILRTVHPLGRIDIAPFREVEGSFVLPSIQENKNTDYVKVGVFDGGANDKHPLLNNYVTEIDATDADKDAMALDHGTAVCGIILHGNLSGTEGKTIPAPSVLINSYRVLPLANNLDIELYEVIDTIEHVVSTDRSTKLYNLSIGPSGAIIDDEISRFTYVLDTLTFSVDDEEMNPLFCIAAGNDGGLDYPLNRIQAPSDMVNGLGIGAYTYNSDNKKIKTSYSCVGEGREGAKVKPDILEFGGSIDRPFIVAGNCKEHISSNIGTSFASPLVVHKLSNLMSKSKNISPHLARTLLLHTAEYDKDIPLYHQGFGFCVDNEEDILTCEDNHITILYVGKLNTAQTVKLPIFAPQINSVSGLVDISWTISTIVDPCFNDPDAYTSNCIEDTFIPHDMTFNFTKKNYKTHKLNLTNSDDMIKAKELLNYGYQRSEHPVSRPSKRYWDETDLRTKDLKWDTIIRKHQRMRGSSLLNPFLSLHAIGRNEFALSYVKYFVAVSISAEKYNGSLYDKVLQTYNNLSPITIRNIERVIV